MLFANQLRQRTTAGDGGKGFWEKSRAADGKDTDTRELLKRIDGDEGVATGWPRAGGPDQGNSAVAL
jgi:hypothetical protein